jgi:hypothetical protein
LPALGIVGLFIGISDVMQMVAKWLTRKRGENWTKEMDYAYLVVLRNFDKGILVRNAVEHRIEFVNWDDIARISRIAPQAQ